MIDRVSNVCTTQSACFPLGGLLWQNYSDMVQLYYSVLRQHCKDERLSSFFNGAEGDECKAVMYRLCAVYKTKAVELPKYEPMALYPQTVERNFYSTFRLILRFIYTLNSRQGFELCAFYVAFTLYFSTFSSYSPVYFYVSQIVYSKCTHKVFYILQYISCNSITSNTSENSTLYFA